MVTTPLPVALLGVLLGWALVVDTLNDWPTFFNLQLYALGFEAVGLWLVLALTAAVLLWAQVSRRWVLSAVMVLAAYVLVALLDSLHFRAAPPTAGHSSGGYSQSRPPQQQQRPPQSSGGYQQSGGSGGGNSSPQGQSRPDAFPPGLDDDEIPF